MKGIKFILVSVVVSCITFWVIMWYIKLPPVVTSNTDKLSLVKTYANMFAQDSWNLIWNFMIKFAIFTSEFIKYLTGGFPN